MQQNLVEERKGKFLMVFPLFVIPFLALLFYSLGGGKGKDHSSTNEKSGLNPNLPSAQLGQTTDAMDKLSLYEQAKKDSLDRLQAASYDPFAEWEKKGRPDTGTERMLDNYHPSAVESPFTPGNSSAGSPSYKKKPTDPDEARVEGRLKELEKIINAVPAPDSIAGRTQPAGAVSSSDSVLASLENMMRELGTGSPAAPEDPELTQMDGMLSKILDIQHPNRVRERLQQQSLKNKGQVFAVSTTPSEDKVELMQQPSLSRFSGSRPLPIDSTGDSTLNRYSFERLQSGGRFYELGSAEEAISTQNAVTAVIHGTQTLVTGSTVELRLEQDAYIAGRLLAKGSSLFGTCALNGERLEIDISSIRLGQSILSVALAAYDLDGLPGIRVPGSISRDAAKQGTDEAIQAISMGTLDPSIGAQAASAGIETVKNLLSKKVKLIKVTVKADYPVLLKDTKQDLN